MTTNPKDEHGEAHTGLRYRPRLSNTGLETYSAIATNEDPVSYDPSRAAGIAKVGGNPADDGISVLAREEARRKAEAEDADQPAGRQLYWVMIADAYLTGEKTMRELAIENQISVYTVRDHIHARRPTFALDHKKRPLGTRRNRDHEPSLVQGAFGTGGNMSDDGVRRATRDLEKAIIALQAKCRMPTFAYRKENMA